MIRIFFLLALLTGSLEAKTLHVLLAADTISDIKVAAHEDLKHLRKELSAIADATGMDLEIKELQGAMLRRSEVHSWIEHQPIQQDDVVFFYFTGQIF